ncbi:pantetheine-phosphate adenylyltransferase [Lacticaseibacillus thailandensis]|uniref:Phosphopantetheine adenylyltransferase n=1 Tax=Lacticaseibacillus thailandensis DSM 22698 = JCM 13996 TaxID=1423810 RepID=A0A0R2C8V4_9LACO|nr:pantetheine-phosphate adenylyltransferase [Lacticaseibacillus thailandensis]KRM88007.1 pantetheine-phosphate adenylyltransferase [Lacticaseibacillus thailandensis DSM 22698 = JCM 13996]
MTERIAIFPGSFDPFTNGHLDTVRRASAIFDRVVVAVMTNTSKQPLFSASEKTALIAGALVGLPNVSVVAQSAALTVDFARHLHAQFIVRGLRNVQDFSYENDIAAVNARLAPDIQTVLLPAKPEYAAISSSIIKEVAAFGGDVSTMVPANVARALQQKLGGTIQ